MADITIGGVAYAVTLPNFKKLKAAWRYIAAVQASADPMDGVDAILGIISVGSSEPVTFDQLEEALTPAELPRLRPFVNDLLVEIGLAAKPGEAADPLADPSPSTGATEPSTDSSTSSSQPAAGA